jgi:hypothetical protein
MMKSSYPPAFPDSSETGHQNLPFMASLFCPVPADLHVPFDLPALPKAGCKAHGRKHLQPV